VSLGQVQSILVCQSSNAVDSTGLCPAGKALTLIDSYVISPASQSYFDQLDQPFDYSVLAQYFALGFSMVISCYLLAKGIGLVMSALRN
jgi:hypothetical protein